MTKTAAPAAVETDRSRYDALMEVIRSWTTSGQAEWGPSDVVCSIAAT